MDTFFFLLISFFSSFFLTGEPGQSPVAVEFSTTTAQVVEVVDGDTIRVLIDGDVQSVRYIGIDTPEPYRDGEPACFSLEASQRNDELVSGKRVELVSDVEDADRYGRLLRYVYADGEMVNEILLREGYAKKMSIKPNTVHAYTFAELEVQARQSGYGLWSECDS